MSEDILLFYVKMYSILLKETNAYTYKTRANQVVIVATDDYKTFKVNYWQIKDSPNSTISINLSMLMA